MVSMLTFSAEGHGFGPNPSQTKDIKIGICCFSAKYTALWSKGKEQLAKIQNRVSW